MEGAQLELSFANVLSSIQGKVDRSGVARLQDWVDAFHTPALQPRFPSQALSEQMRQLCLTPLAQC
eukprot:5893294-Prorocentrum_lima.AAC.1